VHTIDLNCDIGEGFGRYELANINDISPFISSCNVACGFHAGDPLVIKETISRAAEYSLRIGAHPSYPDLQGFGRRQMIIPKEELIAMIQYQVHVIIGFAKSSKATVEYVKPHGALYNHAVQNLEEARTIAQAIQGICPNMKLMGLAGSQLAIAAREYNLGFIAEAFADRRYDANGQLRSRSKKDALIVEPEKAAEQAFDIAVLKRVKVDNEKYLNLNAAAIYERLKAREVEIKA